MRIHNDRAAAATTAVLQIVRDVLVVWTHHERADFAGARIAIEMLLRDDFADVERQAEADRGRRAMKRPLSSEAALDILQHRPDARLTQTMGAHGAEFYVVPGGGRVRPADAAKIIQHRNVVPADAGLFSDFPQSWRYRHA